MTDFRFYFGIGWQHIINVAALDHLLFIAVLAAIYLLKDWKQVLVLITAFTLGHTVTLVLSVKEWVTANSNWVEFLIPCTIAVTAISNLFQTSFTPRAIRVNYFLAFFFGLIHGLAFANTLRMLLATGQSFALSMASFSLGLESGQILVVLLILLLSQLCVGFFKIERRHWVIFISAAAFSLAAEMALQRWPSSGREETNFYKHRMQQNFVAGDCALMVLQWQHSSRRMRGSVQQQNKNETENNLNYRNQIFKKQYA